LSLNAQGQKFFGRGANAEAAAAERSRRVATESRRNIPKRFEIFPQNRRSFRPRAPGFTQESAVLLPGFVAF